MYFGKRNVKAVILCLAVLQLLAVPAKTFAAAGSTLQSVSAGDETDPTQSGVHEDRLPAESVSGGQDADVPAATADIQITDINLDYTEVTLEEKQEMSLQAVVVPEDTTEDRSLTWSSSDPTVADVDQNGRVTAKKAGKADITVATQSGVSSVCHVTVHEKTGYTGWKKEGQNWYYYLLGDLQTGWIEAGGSWYYLDSDGVMQTGWQRTDGNWYYLNPDGSRKSGWLQLNDTWYWLDSDGVMQTGVVRIGGSTYFFNSDGAMQKTGWQKSENIWYYLGSSGAAKTGWLQLGNTWYYLNGKGEMQTGWLQLGNARYYLASSGEMQTGWLPQNGIWYYLSGSGAAKTGWLQLGNTWYYLNSKGEMQTGWLQLGNTRYYLAGSGEMQTGWLLQNGIWYYLNGSGEMQTGWLKLGNTWYYLNSKGEMQTGWLQLGNARYYLNSSGEMQTGWLWIENAWHYLNSNGEMQTGWLQLGNTWYYIDRNGKMQTGWLKEGGSWYYLSSSGAMLTGWQMIDGAQRYFDSSGRMQDAGPLGPLKFSQGDIFQLDSCRAVSYDGNKITVSLSAPGKSSLENISSPFYVVLLNSSGTELVDAAEGEVTKGGTFEIRATFSSNDSFQSFMMGKFAVAVEDMPSYRVISSTKFLTNPDITARKDNDFKDKYWGYYEGYKVTSKKGIQGVNNAYTEDLKVQHVMLNVDIQDLVWVSPYAGYVPYEYKGKTYYFSDLNALRKTILDLHGWGSDEGNAYGENITRNVTVSLLMSWKYDALSYLIHPDARIRGAAPYYALNMKEEKARETYEALFCYLGDKLGQMKCRVNNWTLGNEVNSCNAWNYSGKMSLENCVENYAQAFQLLNQGVKRTAVSPRLFISLDHCWNTADAGHNGKAFLDQFAAYMNRTTPEMEWNVNYHPYSQPLNNSAFWNDYSNTTDQEDTRYISMRNIAVLTNYLSKLESRYGKRQNSIRVILGEVGYSGNGGNSDRLQAAALGYGYYISMFNTRIDSYIIRAYLDDPGETAAGLYLGLRRNDGVQTAKESYAVFKHLNTSSSVSYMNSYLGDIGISGWNTVPGFDAGALDAGMN